MRKWIVLLCMGVGITGFVAPSVRAQCDISGPTSVNADQSFRLCAPAGSGTTYEWSGPGIVSGSTQRCAYIDGRSYGTYQYVLVVRRYDGSSERCTYVVQVGGATGGVGSCTITGPTSMSVNGNAELCGPVQDPIHTYSWSGPGGFTRTGRCITVTEPGTYTLTSRNAITGSVRHCTHYIEEVGGTNQGPCLISGPNYLSRGSTVRLCGPDVRNATFRWTGPGGFASNSRCIMADEAGRYYLRVSNQFTGDVDQCNRVLTWTGDTGDTGNDQGEDVVYENCPRSAQFWARQVALIRNAGEEVPEMSMNSVRSVAACIDSRSSYFNWSGNRFNGLAAALNPSRPMTQRKRLAREYAALLANMCAGERNLNTQSGANISLDADTEIDFNGASTVGELATMVDRMLRTGGGSFAQTTQFVRRVNNGVNIGPTCQE